MLQIKRVFALPAWDTLLRLFYYTRRMQSKRGLIRPNFCLAPSILGRLWPKQLRRQFHALQLNILLPVWVTVKARTFLRQWIILKPVFDVLYRNMKRDPPLRRRRREENQESPLPTHCIDFCVLAPTAAVDALHTATPKTPLFPFCTFLDLFSAHSQSTQKKQA